jgi:hypothetical protein
MFHKNKGKRLCNYGRRTLGKSQLILLTDLTDVELYLKGVRYLPGATNSIKCFIRTKAKDAAFIEDEL